LYNFRKKGLFLEGQNVISWGGGGHKGGLGGISLPLPPSLYVKKGPGVKNYAQFNITIMDFIRIAIIFIKDAVKSVLRI
jgi:hypothetical protein